MDKALKSVLDWWDAAGVDAPNITLPLKTKPTTHTQTKSLSQTTNVPPSSNKPKTPIKLGPENPLSATPILDAAPIAASAKTLAELRIAISKYDAGILSSRARQCVFARGNPEADVMIIGEAPGKDEDIAGQPFVGREGQFLDSMMASIGLTDELVYMTTIFNWRLPQSKNPKLEEIDVCRPFIKRHIELKSPKVILLVGAVSLTALTGLTGVMQNRGQWQTIEVGGTDIPALPIYHPSLLLKQPALKKDAWRDLLELRSKLLALNDMP